MSFPIPCDETPLIYRRGFVWVITFRPFEGRIEFRAFWDIARGTWCSRLELSGQLPRWPTHHSSPSRSLINLHLKYQLISITIVVTVLARPQVASASVAPRISRNANTKNSSARPSTCCLFASLLFQVSFSFTCPAESKFVLNKLRTKLIVRERFSWENWKLTEWQCTASMLARNRNSIWLNLWG